jgi:hypothetical protein
MDQGVLRASTMLEEILFLVECRTTEHILAVVKRAIRRNPSFLHNDCMETNDEII